MARAVSDEARDALIPDISAAAAPDAKILPDILGVIFLLI